MTEGLNMESLNRLWTAGPTFDEDGYPTDGTLQAIREWAPPFDGLLEFMRRAWRYGDAGYWTQEGDHYRISTAGWSGNESLIVALEANRVFWLMSWQESRRGGHYVLDLSWKNRIATPRTEVAP